ncbi:MAG: peroxide stress protein YaaA [Gammaproteobacteria bacterium HGW-Gammaproteobacteria-14]|nr:MAG: peroxide stress protein YaaA [Gammaproteobacteria bacterium HGW-Gammaproteobacteria-14]
MFIVLSPAKTLDYESALPTVPRSLPRLLPQSEALMSQLQTLDPAALGSLMKVSDAIARLNVARNTAWKTEFNRDNSRPAIFAFRGDVYTGLEIERFNNNDLGEAQRRIRILSGLYGLLKPLDLMQPYRLEMGTPLSNPAGRDLYAFWGSTISNLLQRDMDDAGVKVLVNLASQEYFKAVKTNALKARVITPLFEDEKNGKYKIISFYAKKARGRMAAWIVKNKIETPEGLTDYCQDGYRFSAKDSQGDKMVFRREERARA